MSFMRKQKGLEKNDKKERKGWKGIIIEILIDVVIAAIIVGIILGGLYAYCRVWPPLVVIESTSMQHSSDRSSVGTIDVGDLVLVKKVNSRSDIITYIEGKAKGYKKYGDHGDVIIYNKYVSENYGPPVIHRAFLWLEYNSTGFNIPELALLPYSDWRIGTGSHDWLNVHEELILFNLTYLCTTVRINLANIGFSVTGNPHSGFITMGDNNIPRYDQMSPNICLEPIDLHWIVGKARGEIPWFGLIKLWVTGDLEHAPQNSWINLAISIALIIAIPIIIDLIQTEISKYRERKKGGKQQKNSEPTEAPEESYENY